MAATVIVHASDTTEVRVSGITLLQRRYTNDDSTNVAPGTKVYRRAQRGTTDDEGNVFRAN